MVDGRGPSWLVVMHEWSAFPVWDRSPGVGGEFGPDDLPADLVADLRRWNDELTGEPERFRWSDDAARADWIARGRDLARALRRTLGDGVTVVYAPEGDELARFR